MMTDQTNPREVTEDQPLTDLGGHPTRLLRQLGLCPIILVALAGCGTTWDDANGRRHFIGLGHVTWTPGRDGTDTVVVGTDVIGLAVRLAGENAGVSVGYSSDRIVRVGNDTMVELTCLTCDPATARPRITQDRERMNQ